MRESISRTWKPRTFENCKIQDHGMLLYRFFNSHSLFVNLFLKVHHYQCNLAPFIVDGLFYPLVQIIINKWYTQVKWTSTDFIVNWGTRLFFSKFSEHFQNCFPVGIYLLKVKNRNTRTRCEIYSKLMVSSWCLYC